MALDRLEIEYQKGEALLRISECERYINDWEYERSRVEEIALKQLYTAYIQEMREAAKKLQECIETFDRLLAKCFRHDEAIRIYRDFYEKGEIELIPFFDGRFMTDSEFEANRMLKVVRSIAKRYSQPCWGKNGFYVLIWRLEQKYVQEIYALMGVSLED